MSTYSLMPPGEVRGCTEVGACLRVCAGTIPFNKSARGRNGARVGSRSVSSRPAAAAQHDCAGRGGGVRSPDERASVQRDRRMDR
jgi:hypothetical protein